MNHLKEQNSSFIKLDRVSKSYRMGEQPVPVLRDISLEIHQGSTCAILGTSGSGKSTLLNILGLLDKPTSGRFHFLGHDMSSMDTDSLAAIRNYEIGFVFQSFNLLPRLSALDNVALPLTYRSESRDEARERAMHQIKRVGLAHFIDHKPAELSGGQCQRLAIARALIGEPSIILADEPTGSLDSATADSIMALLLSLNQEEKLTLVMVTHDTSLANRLDRKIEVRNGVLHGSIGFE